MSSIKLIFLTLFFSVVAQADLSPIQDGVAQYKNKNYAQAALTFYQMTENQKLSADLKAQANYYLGLSLYKLKLYQASAAPLVNVIKQDSKKYKQKALEKLIAVSNKSGNQDILDFALSEIKAGDLDKLAAEVYYFKMASVSFDKGSVDKSTEYLQKSLEKNPKTEASLNLLALSYLRQNKTQEAIATYQKLLLMYESKNGNSKKKNYTYLNLARAYYQAKKYEEAIQNYLEIPQQSEAYREAQLELGWSYLNLGQDQKAIGSLQNLHTPYYENFYDPESLFLRAILHNHLCQFDEALNIITTFNKNYNFVLETLQSWMLEPVSDDDTMTEIEYAAETLRNQASNNKFYLASIKNYNGRIPFKVTRSILRNNVMKALFEQYVSISEEYNKAQSDFAAGKSQMRPYLDKVYIERIARLKKQVVVVFNKLIRNTEKTMTYYKQQLALVKYEIIDTQKKQLHQKTLAKSINQESNKEVKEIKGKSRYNYEKSGFQYWPYRGEFWKDEVGGSEYYGENRCVEE